VATAWKYVIKGGIPLHGDVSIQGSKNASVAAIPAALLAQGTSTLENLPGIGDVAVFGNILSSLGAEVQYDPDRGIMHIDPNGFDACHAPYELVKRLRASYYLLGVLLARFGKAQVALPGGCEIGLRPVDQHLKGLRALGAEISLEHGSIKAYAPSGLKGASIYLDVLSVGATINTMLAACLAQGTTVIENAAREPHIVDLANYLNAMGAKVQGAGTDVIRIRGVEGLRGTTHAVIPDEIEAATYMMAAVATKGCIRVCGVIPKHLEPAMAKLGEMGARILDEGEAITVSMEGRPSAVNAKTLPYPGFPTDLQQPLTAVLSTADGVSVIHETIYDNRFVHVNELMRMGASIKVDGRTAVIEGVSDLQGAPVRASDLRGGAALVIAGLSAQGNTEIYGVEHVERGYERVPHKLVGLGGSVERVPVD